MRLAKRNYQKMSYSLLSASTPQYETDSSGNIVYTTVDGVQVPVEIGVTEPNYSAPVEFLASISGNLNEMHMRAWGVDQSSVYSEIVCQKGYLPLKVGMLVWRTSEIKWENEAQHIPKASSADYRVVGIMDEGLHEDKLLLQRVTTDE